MTQVPLGVLHAAVMSDDTQGLLGGTRHTVTFNLPPTAEILHTARPAPMPLLPWYLLVLAHPLLLLSILGVAS